MKRLEVVFNKPGFWDVDGLRTRVVPFPGKYPTRWRVTVFKGDVAVLDYITRPGYEAYRRVLRLAKQRCTIRLVEADRGGAFLMAAINCPAEVFRVCYHNAILRRFYYPWHIQGDFFASWRKSVFHKKLVLHKHRFFVYSPHEKMTDALIPDVSIYKSWLRKQNPWK